LLLGKTKENVKLVSDIMPLITPERMLPGAIAIW
jgi:hypothetical protein